MDRYSDNVSPDPSSMIKINNCYKTPELTNTHYHSLNSGMNGHFPLYPTPPSENDESNSSYGNEIYSNKKQNEFTPVIGNHYNPMHENSLDDDVSQNIQQTSNVQVNRTTEASNVNSSRYRRRSRTTYSKSQLDVLESTFQKTHYPEIRMVDDLSSTLNLSTERISIWFQNRRARFKKSRKLETCPETSSSYVQAANASTFMPSPPLNSKPLTSPRNENVAPTSYLPLNVNNGYHGYSNTNSNLGNDSRAIPPVSTSFPFDNQINNQSISNSSHVPINYSNHMSSFYNQNFYGAIYSSYQNTTP